MLQISKEEIKKLIKIAKLEVDDSIFDKISEKIIAISSFSEDFEGVDVEGVDPMFSVFDVLHESLANYSHDEVRTEDLREAVLSNVPEVEDVFISVNKVIEKN